MIEQQTVNEFLTALSSKRPTPGGGGASALAGALSGALGLMVGNLTVGKKKYKVYRYEGPVNGVGKAVVLLSYPENAFGEPSALCAFLCTNCTLSIEEILTIYIERWSIEVFFFFF